MGWFPKRTIGDVLRVTVDQYGDRSALIYGARSWTWAEFVEEVDRLAVGLMGIGVEAGDHVGLWMTNRPEWLFAMFAIPRIGAVSVPLNTRYRVDDASYAIDQSDITTLLAIDRSGPIDYLAMLTEMRPALPKLRRVAMLGDTSSNHLSWDTMLAAGASVSPAELEARASSVDPDLPMLIVYTSGTTSAPKGAVHSHAWLRRVAERAQLLGLRHDDVHLSYLPLFHAYGYSEIAATCAVTGACQVLMDIFEAEEALDLAERHHATIVHGFDTHYQDLVRAQRAAPRALDLRLGTLPAGMESTRAIAHEVQEVLCPTVSGWGMSEVWAFAAMSHPSDTVEQRCEASGYPMLDSEFRLVDLETGGPIKAGEPGELLVRTYSTMLGYYNKPDATRATIDPDGWVHTGDLVTIRPDGHLRLIGRCKDMLKVGGENVAPAEIEDRLLDLPAIDEIAVIGTPDERLGEVAAAFVTLHPGTKLSLQDLVDHLEGRVASFKVPRQLFVIDEMPMTASGKIRKADLRVRARST